MQWCSRFKTHTPQTEEIFYDWAVSTCWAFHDSDFSPLHIHTIIDMSTWGEQHEICRSHSQKPPLLITNHQPHLNNAKLLEARLPHRQRNSAIAQSPAEIHILLFLKRKLPDYESIVPLLTETRPQVLGSNVKIPACVLHAVTVSKGESTTVTQLKVYLGAADMSTLSF